MNYRRGDVVLVLFPDSNLRTSKRRPAVVVQADRLDADLPQRIVAMITSNMARAGHPSRVIVRIDNDNARGCGLLMDSVIMTDNLATILDSEIDRVIGTFKGMPEIDPSITGHASTIVGRAHFWHYPTFGITTNDCVRWAGSISGMPLRSSATQAWDYRS